MRVLIACEIVDGREARIHKLPPTEDRWKIRSRTFQGIADALATQYTAFIKSGMTVSEWENIFNGAGISRHNATTDKYVQL